tara:strand:- start:42 stop:614 length:573 start_codon:yes stop_codon:yes gene_type:complete
MSKTTIPTAGLADDAVDNTKLDLTSNYAFTGTVTGAGGGITMADQWRITATQSGNAEPITANLERVDTAGQGYLGTGMSVSSGIWTFPTTGIYYVEWKISVDNVGAEDGRIDFDIMVTTNNSSYSEVARGFTHSSVNDARSAASVCSLIDVTDTSQVKVRFDLRQNDANNVSGATGNNQTHFTFIRLGDT